MHVVLYKVETDEKGDVTVSDILEEEEVDGHAKEFDDEDVARYAFTMVSGVDVQRR
jgi:hypothetical protein